MLSRLIIGVFLYVEMWIFFLLNIVCIVCMFTSHLFAKEDNPAYLITSFNLLAETCQLLLHIIYVGPSILLGTWFFKDQSSLGVTIMGIWFLGFWYLGSFIQILMAMNRLCVVFFHGRNILTHFRIKLIMLAMCLVTLGCLIYSQLLSPCCRITPDYRYFSYSYLIFETQTENSSMTFVDLPLTLPPQSYVQSLTFLLCVQFSLMFLCYTISWTTFFLFPKLEIKIPEPYVTSTAVLMVNCGMNAVIYLTLNNEIQFELKKLLGKVSHSVTFQSSVRIIPNPKSQH